MTLQGRTSHHDDFIEDFAKDVPRGMQTRSKKIETAPQARWQSPTTILSSKMLCYNPDNPGGKLLMGAFGNKLIGIDDNRHVMTVAGSRSGKSVLLTANLLLYRGSVLAIDPKGELSTLTAKRREDMGQKVHVLDPFQRVRGDAVRFRSKFNPMARLTLENETIIEDAGLIADALVVSEGSKDQHWNESARNLIAGLILHVATATEYADRRNLLSVRQCLRDILKVDPDSASGMLEQLEYLLDRQMQENALRLRDVEDGRLHDVADAIDGAASDFYDKAEEERSGVLSNARRHTQFLDYRAMRRVLDGHDFELEALKADDKGVSVYLCLPAGRLSSCARWFRIFIMQMLIALEQVEQVPEAPVLVCLDEFPVLGHMKMLEDAVGQVASSRVRLWFILQDWGQGEALYGKRWESFAANSGILQCFGNTDVTTTEYISKRLGMRQVEKRQRSEVGARQAEDGLSGSSLSSDQVPLMTPDEIARQFARADELKRQIVFWAGFHPLMIQRVEYFDQTGPHHRVFAGKY